MVLRSIHMLPHIEQKLNITFQKNVAFFTEIHYNIFITQLPEVKSPFGAERKGEK